MRMSVQCLRVLACPQRIIASPLRINASMLK